jgi:hypothetical protein
MPGFRAGIEGHARPQRRRYRRRAYLHAPLQPPHGKKDYLRGYGSQFWNTGAQANARIFQDLPGFGADFKKSVKDRYPALVAMHPYGEVLPYKDNRVVVECSNLDQYGVPISRIEYKIGEE